MATPTISVEALVEPAAQAHGIYRVETLPVTAGELGQPQHGTMKVVRNRGGTTIERWLARGDITIRQAEAITLYARAWRMWIGEQRVTANWSLTASFRGGTMDFDAFADTKLKAKRLLDQIDDDVFFLLPLGQFNVWQNVVIFDEAAGVAGSRLGYSSKQAEAVAKITVLTIADMIANVLRLGDQRRAA